MGTNFPKAVLKSHVLNICVPDMSHQPWKFRNWHTLLNSFAWIQAPRYNYKDSKDRMDRTTQQCHFCHYWSPRFMLGHFGARWRLMDHEWPGGHHLFKWNRPMLDMGFQGSGLSHTCCSLFCPYWSSQVPELNHYKCRYWCPSGKKTPICHLDHDLINVTVIY